MVLLALWLLRGSWVQKLTMLTTTRESLTDDRESPQRSMQVRDCVFVDAVGDARCDRLLNHNVTV